MPCISKVAVIRNTRSGVIDMVLLCEGGCSDGSCMIVNDMKSAAPVSDAELGQQGIVKQPGKVYVKYTERCACMDDRGQNTKRSASRLYAAGSCSTNTARN